jgi:hypothetical protein
MTQPEIPLDTDNLRLVARFNEMANRSMKRIGILTRVMAFLITGVIGAVSQSVDQQLGFAEHLQRSGDAPFALLEFKRFMYLNPKDSRAASANRQIADIYFGYFKDINSGKAALAQLLEDYPKSKEAPSAQETLNLLSVYRGANQALLLDYLEGSRLARTGDAKGAAARLTAFANKSSDQQLAATALLSAGKLQLAKLNKPADAIKLFEQVVRKAPNSPQYHEALFRTGEAWEKITGNDSNAMQAYGLVAASKNPFQAQAQSAIARLRQKQNLPKRQYDAKLAGQYKTLRTDPGNDTVIVTVEVPTGASPQVLNATMEKVLFDTIGKRKDPKHHVVINAYYSYPITEAGGVNWRVGNAPQFTVKKMKTEDAVKTLIFDLFKKR